MSWNDLNALFFRLLRRWWIVAGITIVVLALAGARVSSSPDRYRTTTMLLIGPNVEMEASEVLRAADLVSRGTVAATFADVLASPLVVNPAMSSVTSDFSQWSRYDVRVVNEPDSSVLRLIVEGPTSDDVRALTNAIRAQSSVAMSQLLPIYTISPLYTSEASPELVSLPWVRALGLALVVGLTLGSLVALWYDSLLQYRRSSQEVPSSSRTVPVTAADRRTAGTHVAPVQQQ